MLTNREALLRLVVAIGLFLLSGTETVTGSAAMVCGILGTMELATALLRYSPLMELLNHYPSITQYITFGLATKQH